MAHASVIYLYKGIKLVPGTADEEDRFAEYQRRALNAAQDIVELATTGNRSRGHKFESLLVKLLKIFEYLKSPNNPDQSYLDLLRSSCTTGSIELARGTSCLV